MSKEAIERLYRDTEELLAYLEEQRKVSLKNTVEKEFPKTLLLAAASYFETMIKETLTAFFQEYARDPLTHFVSNRAIERQYHTYFNWSAKNANQFFGLFGEGFKTFMAAEVKQNQQLGEAIQAFITLGDLRNQLVHQNFVSFTLQKTAKEIFALYTNALFFVETFPLKLREYIESNPSSQ